MKKMLMNFSLALGCIFFLTACGFTPVYGVNGAGIGKVEIAPIEGRVGYFLAQNLQRRVGLENDNSNPRQLKIIIKQRYNNVALRTDGFATRTRITFDAEYSLSESATEGELKGQVTSIVSFDSVERAYSDVSLQSDAEERAANDLAERIWADIINKRQKSRR